MRVLGQTVGNVVIVALLRHKDMDTQFRAGGLIKRTHGYAYPVFFKRLEKQRGTTAGAKSPLHLFRRTIPGEVLTAVNCQGVFGNVSGHEIMAGLPATLSAMTRIGRRKLGVYFEPDSPTKT